MNSIAAPQGTVSNNTHADNFKAIDAVETLLAHLVRIEAVARVACEAADELRSPSGRSAKRELMRMQIFVGQAAHEAVEAVTQADRLMSDLNGQRRPRAEREPGAKRTRARSNQG